MTVYPLYHSGFFVELDEHYLLFDCISENIPLLNPDKPLYVFISHFHSDHFSPDIKRLTAYYPHRTFITGMVEGEGFNVMSPGGHLEFDGLSVSALGSTDEGAAFLINTEGKTIFHAGDLHLWYWEDDTPQERQDMLRRYMAETEKLKGLHIDLAFLVLDSRQQEPDALLGMDIFNGMTDTENIFPMHYSSDPSLLGERISRLKRNDNVIDTRRKKRYEL